MHHLWYLHSKWTLLNELWIPWIEKVNHFPEGQLTVIMWRHLHFHLSYHFKGILIFLNYFFWCWDEIKWTTILGLMIALIINKNCLVLDFWHILIWKQQTCDKKKKKTHTQSNIACINMVCFSNLKSLKEVHGFVFSLVFALWIMYWLKFHSVLQYKIIIEMQIFLV